jgi:hypothetical protein
MGGSSSSFNVQAVVDVIEKENPAVIGVKPKPGPHKYETKCTVTAAGTSLQSIYSFVKSYDGNKDAYGRAFKLYKGGDDNNADNDAMHRYNIDEHLGSLVNTEYTVGAEIRERMIRSIAVVLKNLGLAINPSDELTSLIKSMKKAIPSKETGQGFKTDTVSHNAICKMVADVLNKEFTPGKTNTYEMLIDTSLSPENICKKVSEWVHSFSIGVNTEFLAIYGSLTNALRNITVLDALLDSTFRQIETKILQDQTVSTTTRQLRELFNIIKAEATRQKELLKNILNITLPPSMKELELVINDQASQLALIKNIGVRQGSPEFSKLIETSLKGLSSTAEITHKVNKALEAIKMKVDVYLKSKDYKEFVTKVDTAFDEMIKTGKNSDGQDINVKELQAAAELLKRQFHEREKMNIKGSAEFNLFDLLNEKDQPMRTELEKQIEMENQTKIILIKTFIKRMETEYTDFNRSISKIGHKFGKLIPITEYTDVLRDTIVQLKDFDSDDVSLVLIGYYTDTTAREIKEKYISKLLSISHACDNIIGQSEYKEFTPDFKELKEIIHRILNIIETYSKGLMRKEGGCGCDGKPVVKGATEDASINIDLDEIKPVIAKSQWILRKSISDFVYFYYMSRVYNSLTSAAKETESASGSKYIEILGDSVATEIQRMYKDRDTILSRFDLIKEAKEQLKRDDANTSQYFHIKASESKHMEINENAVIDSLDEAVIDFPNNSNNNFLNKYELPSSKSINNVPIKLPMNLSDVFPGSVTVNIYDLYDQLLPEDQLLTQSSMVDIINQQLKRFINSDVYNKWLVILLNIKYNPVFTDVSYIKECVNKIITFCLEPNAQAYNDVVDCRLTESIITIEKDSLREELKQRNNIIEETGYDSALPVEINKVINITINKLYKYHIKIINDVNKKDLAIIFKNNLLSSNIINKVDNNIVITGGANITEITHLTVFVDHPWVDSDKAIATVKRMVEKEFSVKINFYKVLQAIDIYLKEFTINISMKPDSVKNIAKILDGTQIIADWFNDETGDNIWKSFECMGSSKEIDDELYTIYHNWTPIQDNDNSNNKSIFTNMKSSEHYYDALYKTVINNESSDKPYNVTNPFIGVPCSLKEDNSDRAKISKNYLSEAVDGFQALKNLLNAFVRIGEDFGGSELYKKVFMSPSQIYKYLIEYIKHSAYFVNYGKSAEFKPNMEIKRLVPEYYMSFSHAFNINFNNFEKENKYFTMIIKAMSAKILVVLGIYDMFDHRQKIDYLNPVRMIVGGNDHDKTLFKHYKTTMEGKEIEIMMTKEGNTLNIIKKIKMEGNCDPKEFAKDITKMCSDQQGHINIHKDGNTIMVSKKIILSDTNTDNEAEMHANREIEHLMPKTDIGIKIGSSDKDIPGRAEVTAIPEASELYFRFPRLVEFYRKLLYWRGDDSDEKITMLPKIGGVFSNIIRIIFQKIYSPETGNYSDFDARLVIDEINSIYKFFKKQDKDCLYIIHEFVKEINRKIGIVKSNDMKKYWDMQSKLITNISSRSFKSNNIGILPDEINEWGEGMAPSDHYMLQRTNKTTINASERDVRYKENIKLLRDFRGSIESLFDNYKPVTDFSSLSFNKLIKDSMEEMKKQSDPKNKLHIAMKLIQSTKESNIDADKAFMFHETVVAGLNALGSIYEFVSNFQNFIKHSDPVQIEITIIEYLRANILSFNETLYSVNNIDLTDLQKYYLLNENENLGERLNHDAGGVNYSVGYLYYIIKNFPNIFSEPRPVGDNSVIDYTNNEKFKSNDYYLAIRTIVRYLVNYKRIMADFIENLFNFANGELISVRFIQDSSVPIQFDFGNLVSVVEEMIIDIKSYINKFRTYFTKDIIDRYESINNVGSVYWFENEFIDKLFRGKGITRDKPYEEGTLNEISQLTNNVFNNLIRDTGVSLYTTDQNDDILNIVNNGTNDRADIISYFRNKKTIKNDIHNYEYYGNLISEMVYYNNTSYNLLPDYDCVNLVGAYPGPSSINDVLNNVGFGTNAKKLNGLEHLIWAKRLLGNKKQADFDDIAVQDTARFKIWNDDKYTESKSLLFAFNQLVALHLKASSDSMSYKIYNGLINAFVSGSASNSVYNPRGGAFPDLVITNDQDDNNQPIASFGRRGDPKSNCILTSSLSYILQRLTRDYNTIGTNTPDYLIETLSEVPSYLMDKYKTVLPYDSKLFLTLYQKCDFIKDLIQKTRINCTRTSQNLIYGADFIEDRNGIYNVGDEKDRSALEELSGSLQSEDVKTLLSTLIDSISQQSYIIMSSIDQTINDLAMQTPKYFETYSNFINTYKNKYAKNPLMPLSFALFFVKPLERMECENVALSYDCMYRQDIYMNPTYMIGSTESKLQYGMRPIILSRDVNIENYPGIMETINKYNKNVISANNIDMNQYQKFIKNFITIIRYNLDNRNFKSYVQQNGCSVPEGIDLSIPPLDASCVLIQNFATTNYYYAIDDNKSYMRSFAYNTKVDKMKMVYAIENSNQDDVISKIINNISKKDEKEITRMSECIANIVDLNIVPINLNVLMKEIPLFNLYNYDYTFELMVARLYNKNHVDFKDKDVALRNVRDTQDAFITLLYHPYINLLGNRPDAIPMNLGISNTLGDYYEFLGRIMRGDNNLGLGRPKFLSDELYNKVLLRSVYPSAQYFDEAGATASISLYRGQYGYDATHPDPNIPMYRNWLTYSITDKDGKFIIRHREFGEKMFNIIENIGRLRFDTTFIRNLFFIVNVLRVTRLKLFRELNHSRDVVASTHRAVTQGLTEYGLDPFNPNEIYTSKNVIGESRIDYGIE